MRPGQPGSRPFLPHPARSARTRADTIPPLLPAPVGTGQVSQEPGAPEAREDARSSARPPGTPGTLANLKRTYVIMHSQLLLARLHSHKRDAPLPHMVVIDFASVSKYALRLLKARIYI